MISRMPAPPIVNNLELRDGWSVDISTIHNGRFTESVAFVMMDGKSVPGDSHVDLRWAIGHMEACTTVYMALSQWMAQTSWKKQPLTLEDIIKTIRLIGARQ